MQSGTNSTTMRWHVRPCTVTRTFGRVLSSVSDNTAYVLGQIPLMTLQTKAKMWVARHVQGQIAYAAISAPFLLPTLQIAWAIIAFVQSEVTQSWHLYILRAITGFLEASSFGGTHLISRLPWVNVSKPQTVDNKQSVPGSRTRRSSSAPASGSWATRSAPCSPATFRPPSTVVSTVSRDGLGGSGYSWCRASSHCPSPSSASPSGPACPLRRNDGTSPTTSTNALRGGSPWLKRKASRGRPSSIPLAGPCGGSAFPATCKPCTFKP